MPASSISGYLQGYRFSDAGAYWDGTTFEDQGPYTAIGNTGLTITTGTPAFVTDATSGQRGLTLDNTVHGEFLFPIPWEGCAIMVAKPSMGTNGTIYPVIIGGATAVGSNGTLQVQRATPTDYRHQMVSYSAQLVSRAQVATSALAVVALSMSQETRKGYATPDGVTVTESGPVAAAVNGNGCAPGMAVNPYLAGFKARFGNLSGTLGDTVATANTMTIFELHFFKGNPLVDSLAAVKAFIDELKETYGIA